MSEYQVTYWRDLPSLVIARDGEETAKVPLPPRFMEAIDEAAMRIGATGSDDYLAGWRKGDWTAGEGTPADLAARVAASLDEELDEARVAALLDALGPASEEG